MFLWSKASKVLNMSIFKLSKFEYNLFVIVVKYNYVYEKIKSYSKIQRKMSLISTTYNKQMPYPTNKKNNKSFYPSKQNIFEWNTIKNGINNKYLIEKTYWKAGDLFSLVDLSLDSENLSFYAPIKGILFNGIIESYSNVEQKKMRRFLEYHNDGLKGASHPGFWKNEYVQRCKNNYIYRINPNDEHIIYAIEDSCMLHFRKISTN